MDPRLLIIPEVLFPIALRYSEYRKKYGAALVFKTLASLVFVAIGFLVSGGFGNDAFSDRVLSGLILGAAGDVFLSLRHVAGKRHIFFCIGSGFFLLGHVLYLAALLPRLLDTGLLIPAVLAALAVSGILTLFLWRRIRAGRLVTLAGALYVCAVSSVAVFGIFRLFSGPFQTGLLLFAAGGVFFAASDTILIDNTFGSKRSFRKDCVLIALYYAGQTLIALSL